MKLLPPPTESRKAAWNSSVMSQKQLSVRKKQTRVVALIKTKGKNVQGANALLYSPGDTAVSDTCADIKVGWGPVLQPSACSVQLFTKGPPQGCRV